MRPSDGLTAARVLTGKRLLLVLGLCALGCRAAPTDPEGKRQAPAAAMTSREPTPVSSNTACPKADVLALEQLQGRWNVLSSSGVTEKGHVFRALEGAVLTITGDRLTYPERTTNEKSEPTTYTVTKRISLPTCTSPQAIDLEQTSDAKGWSRVGIIELREGTLVLVVNFPQNPRPTSFDPADDGREIVKLGR